MQKLQALRAGLTNEQRAYINEMWQYFLLHGKWPVAWDFHSPNRKTAIRNALKSLSGSIVYETSDSQYGSRYCLTLLGILLTDNGSFLEVMISRYFEFCRRRYQTQPANRAINSSDLQSEMSLDDEQLKLLGRIVIIGNLFGESAGYDPAWASKDWSVGILRETDGFPSDGNLDREVEHFIFRGFSTAKPVFLDERQNDHFAVEIPSVDSSLILNSPKDNNSDKTMNQLQAWSILRSILHEKCTFGGIKVIVGFGGIDSTQIAHLEQKSGGRSASKSELLSAIDVQVGQMSEQRVGQYLRAVTEVMLKKNPELEEFARESLERLGWTLRDGHLIEVAVLDISELPELPFDAHDDLVKASIRLRDGDLTGAISSACAAVDSVTSKIYHQKNLGDATKVSFQERVSQSLKALNTFTEVERQLIELGWDKKEASTFANNLRGSLNQASYILQTLRSKMGDVHGSKPILKPLVFDSIKWAMLTLRLLT